MKEAFLNRRDFLKAAGAAGAAVSAMPRRSFAAAGKRPNIIYLFSDEHRYQSMSFTDMPLLRTPNMLRMAAQGTSFKYAVSNNPVCVPHRCMLLSGQWPHRTGAVENAGGLAPQDQTIGHVFHQAGYVTGYTGKWHAGGFAAQAGFDWHMLWEKTDEHWNCSWTDLRGTGKTESCHAYQPVMMTGQALEFLDANAGGVRPFFLMVSWNPPHAVFTDAPDDKKALYPDASALPWRENAQETTKDKWWNNYQGYHAHITAVDEQIGRIYERLEKLGILDNTIVIYSADHGSMMNSHGMGNKRHAEDESCRVPFLITGPGIPQGQTRRELFGSIDIFPTLCALAGIPKPAFCDGLDFSANIYNRSGVSDPESQLIMHAASAKSAKRAAARKGTALTPEEIRDSSDAPFFRGVRGKRYTYTVGCGGESQLWDNQNDPLQQTNLISDPAYGEIKKKLRSELDAWLAKAEYPFLNDTYRRMTLPQSILQQAVDRSAELPLHHMVTRLKLSPEQYALIPGIRGCYYDDSGHPKDRTGGKASWERAEKSVIRDIRALLDDGQKVLFDKMADSGTEPGGESGGE
ncbi:MAG: sulfatase-like hydrolase/transferase [Kiritimatiellales bacterium]|jgi:arylsulfatase A-like enzyme